MMVILDCFIIGNVTALGHTKDLHVITTISFSLCSKNRLLTQSLTVFLILKRDDSGAVITSLVKLSYVNTK